MIERKISYSIDVYASTPLGVNTLWHTYAWTGINKTHAQEITPNVISMLYMVTTTLIQTHAYSRLHVHQLCLYMSIHNVTYMVIYYMITIMRYIYIYIYIYIYVYICIYMYVCMYSEAFFSYLPATLGLYSDSNVYMSLFIMSLMINVYMWNFQMNKNDKQKHQSLSFSLASPAAFGRSQYEIARNNQRCHFLRRL